MAKTKTTTPAVCQFCGNPADPFLTSKTYAACVACNWKRYLEIRDAAIAAGTHTTKSPTFVCAVCKIDKPIYEWMVTAGANRGAICFECSADGRAAAYEKHRRDLIALTKKEQHAKTVTDRDSVVRGDAAGGIAQPILVAVGNAADGTKADADDSLRGDNRDAVPGVPGTGAEVPRTSRISQRARKGGRGKRG